jgi:hypothetical protein
MFFVYFLSRSGLNFLRAHDVEVDVRYRPSEEQVHSYMHLAHTLSVNDVLIAAELLCRQSSDLALEAVLHERVLKRRPVHVEVGTGERIGVIPDGWLDFRLAGKSQTCVALELDRGTVEQKQWRRKVRGLVAWAKGPYQAQFQTTSLTVAVVATPGPKRVRELVNWTEAELGQLGRQEAELFRFTGLSPDVVEPAELFLAPRWCTAFGYEAVPLLEGQAR